MPSWIAPCFWPTPATRSSLIAMAFSPTATEALTAFWRSLRPDPWPEPPEWMNPTQATAWVLGFNAGRMEGRRLEAAERGCGGAGDG
jgi:hypothetical protein